MNFINVQNATKYELGIINKIAERYCEFTGADFLTTQMDITAVHCNCLKLDLVGLMDADNFNLYHDVAGIAANLDREEIILTNHFRPRFASKEG